MCCASISASTTTQYIIRLPYSSFSRYGMTSQILQILRGMFQKTALDPFSQGYVRLGSEGPLAETPRSSPRSFASTVPKLVPR